MGTLNYAVSINIFKEDIVIDRQNDNLHIPYQGNKYTNHFKFKFDLSSTNSRYQSAYANLIISKVVTNTTIDSYGRAVEEFDTVLDISYNDHHGDYIPLTCTRKYFILSIDKLYQKSLVLDQ